MCWFRPCPLECITFHALAAVHAAALVHTVGGGAGMKQEFHTSWSGSLKVEVGVAPMSVPPREPPQEVEELALLKDQLNNLRQYVDSQLKTLERQLHSCGRRLGLQDGAGDVGCARERGALCQPLGEVREPSCAAPELPSYDLEDLQQSNRLLGDRLDRLELLLFCLPVPEFQKIDESIKALKSGALLPASPSAESVQERDGVSAKSSRRQTSLATVGDTDEPEGERCEEAEEEAQAEADGPEDSEEERPFPSWLIQRPAAPPQPRHVCEGPRRGGCGPPEALASQDGALDAWRPVLPESQARAASERAFMTELESQAQRAPVADTGPGGLAAGAAAASGSSEAAAMPGAAEEAALELRQELELLRSRMGPGDSCEPSAYDAMLEDVASAEERLQMLLALSGDFDLDEPAFGSLD